MQRKKKIITNTPGNYSYRSNQVTKNNWHEKFGSVSDWVGIVINLLVAIVTLFLFSQTKKATNAAIQAANTADSTYREQRWNDSVLRRRDSINSIANNINERNRFILDSTSVAAQIQYLRETQKQFEIANEAFLQIRNPAMVFDVVNKTYEYKYVIENLGKYPAKTEYEVDVFVLDEAFITFNNLLIKKGNVIKPNMVSYLVNGNPFPVTTPKEPITEDQVEAFKNGAKVYLTGIVRYQNIITKKTREYRYQVRLTPITNKYRFFTNENIAIN